MYDISIRRKDIGRNNDDRTSVFIIKLNKV